MKTTKKVKHTIEREETYFRCDGCDDEKKWVAEGFSDWTFLLAFSDPNGKELLHLCGTCTARLTGETQPRLAPKVRVQGHLLAMMRQRDQARIENAELRKEIDLLKRALAPTKEGGGT